MNERDVRAVLEGLFIHVAAMPWADTGFTRSEAAKQAAKDQILDYSVKEIIKLNKEQNEKGTNTETTSRP